MKWLKKISATTAAIRIIDESLYAQAFNEFSHGIRRDGLWAKALANAEGDEIKASGLYLQYRVQSYKDEATLLEQATATNLTDNNHYPSSHAGAQQNGDTVDHKQRLAGSDLDQQPRKQTSQPAFPQIPVAKKEVPSWALDREEIEGFKNSVKILAAGDGVSKSYAYECMKDDVIFSSILHHIGILEKRGGTYMEQVSLAVEEVGERWNMLLDEQQERYNANDAF